MAFQRNLDSAIHHRMVMSLLPAKRDGSRYVNPVPTNGGRALAHVQSGPAFPFRSSGTVAQTSAGPVPYQFTSLWHEARNRACALPGLVTPPLWLKLTARVSSSIYPVWDERAAPTRWAGPKRFLRPPLSLEDLPAIDAVLISHNHYDHLGSGTVRRLAQMDALRQARWISPLGVDGHPGEPWRRSETLHRTQLDGVEYRSRVADRHRFASSSLLGARPLRSLRNVVGVIRTHRHEAPRLLRRRLRGMVWLPRYRRDVLVHSISPCSKSVVFRSPVGRHTHGAGRRRSCSFRAMGGYGLLMLVGRGMPRKGRERRCEPQPTLAEGQPPDAPYSQSSCECCSQAQGERLRDRAKFHPRSFPVRLADLLPSTCSSLYHPVAVNVTGL